MVYKKYIKKKVNGKWKTFGQYYYHSYRDKEGISRTKYTSEKHFKKHRRAVTKDKFFSLSPKKHLALFLVLGIFVLFVGSFLLVKQQIYGDEIINFKNIGGSVGGFVDRLTGFVTEETPSEVEPKEVPVEEPPAEEAPIEPESDPEPVEEILVEEPDQVGGILSGEEPAPDQVGPGEGVSPDEGKEEVEIEGNETDQVGLGGEVEEEVNETIGDVEIVNETITTEENATITEANITVIEEGGATIVNVESIEVSEKNITIVEAEITKEVSVKQYGAVLGEPVRWEKKIKVNIDGEKSVSKLEVDIPKIAESIKIKKESVQGKKEGAISFVVQEKKSEGGSGPFETVFNFILGFFSKSFSLTGQVVEDIPEDVVEIGETIFDGDEIVIEYYTAAPYSEERVVDENSKEIDIIGPDEVHYESILVNTPVEPEAARSAIKLYYVSEETYLGDLSLIEADMKDNNGNGLIDSVEWVVPHLSKQKYVLNLTRGEETRVIIKMRDVGAKNTFKAYGVKNKDLRVGNWNYEVKTMESSMALDIGESDLIEGVFIDDSVGVLLEDSEQIIRSIDVKNEFGVSGLGQKICILDTGVDYNHPDITNYVGGYDFINNDSDPYDDNGHGTSVAGVISVIAPDSELLVTKVLDSNGIGYESDVLQGLQWCIDQNVDIISFSIGAGSYYGACDTNIVAELVNEAVSQGIFVTAATGNDGSTNLKAPACASNATRVASTDKLDLISGFSNVNKFLDLFAPGQDVSVPSLGGGYSTQSGTSISAPMVAAGAALVLENETLNPSELKYRFKTTGKPIRYSLDLLTRINISRIDVYNAIINNITMTPYGYNMTEGEGNETNQTYGGEAIAIDGCAYIKDGTKCANGEGCCSNSVCYESKGFTNDAGCYSDRDAAGGLCEDYTYCVASGDVSGSVCTSGWVDYGINEDWISTADSGNGECCGDDSLENFASESDGVSYCCRGGLKVDDSYCAFFGADWQIDGTMCTGTVYTPDGTLNPTGGDDATKCGCDVSTDYNAVCDDSDSDDDADGICVSGGSCVGTNVAKSGSTYYSCSSSYDGLACDTNVVTSTTSASWVSNSVCLYGGGCDATHVVFTGSAYYSCTSTYDGDACDISTTGTYTTDSICLTSGSCDATCVAASGDTYYSCSASYNGWTADTSTSNGAFSQNSMCAAGSCCTDEVISTGTYECDCDENDVSSEKQCDNSVTSGTYSAEGICANDGAGTADSDANCEVNGAEICIDSGNGNKYTKTATNCVDGDGCDSVLASADYVRDGYVCNDQGLGCVVDGSRAQGESCCDDANCAGEITCNANICAPPDSAPEITLNSPPNDYNTSSYVIVFNATVADDINLVNVTLWGNWTGSWIRNETNSSGINATYIFTKDLTSYGEGEYLWGIEAYDNASQGNVSSNRTFTIDVTNPNINITSPLHNTNTTDTGLDLNYTVANGAQSCWYSNDTMSKNLSLGTACTNITNITWGEGQHNVTVWANDSANNEGKDSVTFTIDTLPPYFTNWANQSMYNNQSLNYDIDADDDGVGLDSFDINWSGTFSIVTSTGELTNTSALSVGLYYINVSINDTLNNLNSSVLRVNVSEADFSPPVISNAEINATSPVALNSRVKVNATIIDAHDNLETVILEVIPPTSSAYNVTPSSSGDQYYNNTIVLNENGQWKFRFYANDTLGQDATPVLAKDQDANGYILVQTLGTLNVLLVSPTGDNNNQPQNQTFEISANVTCNGVAEAVCGNVNGTIQYNLSAADPDTLVQGNGNSSTPFYALELNPFSCGPLNVSGGTCNITWNVNTTGIIVSKHKLNVNFTSDESTITSNTTNSTTIRIISPTLSLILSNELSDVKFGDSLTPGTSENPALNNSVDNYTVTCYHSNANCNVSIKGNDNMVSGANIIGLGNVSWNIANETGSDKSLSTIYSVVNATLGDTLTQAIYFWLDVPSGVVAGNYKTNFTIYGESN